MFSLGARKKLDEVEAAQHVQEAKELREFEERLRKYLVLLDEEEALKSSGEGFLVPHNLENFKLAEVKTLTGKTVEKMVYDAIKESRGLEGKQAQALNNYVRLAEIGRVADEPASIALDRISPESRCLLDEIHQKKLEILGLILGPAMFQCLENMKSMLKRELKSDA